MKVSSRVIAMPRKRNPPSRGSASNSGGKPDVISCARSSICLVILPQLSVVGEADNFPASTAFNSRQFYRVGHNGAVITHHGIQRMLSCFVPGALLFLWPMVLSSAATLDDLKQLEITCYVPSYLTQGLRLQNVEVTYDEIQEMKIRTTHCHFTQSNMEMAGTRHSPSSQREKASATETSWPTRRTRKKLKSNRLSAPCI